MNEINATPNKVLLAMPVMDFKVDILTLGGLIPLIASQAVQPFFLAGNSNIRHARNLIAHKFKMMTEFDTLFCVDADIAFTMQDFMFMMEGHEPLVYAPYARKVVGREPVEFGFGFVRIHRSVFAQLDAWDSTDGTEALNRFRHDGELVTDYHFDGATPDARWFGEDTGFFHWCSMLDIRTRREERCRLGHVGRYVYGYPDQTPGLIPVEAGAQ